MANKKNHELSQDNGSQSRMPNSNFYEKVVPAALIGLGVLTAVLIIVALGIAFGIIPY